MSAKYWCIKNCDYKKKKEEMFWIGRYMYFIFILYRRVSDVFDEYDKKY